MNSGELRLLMVEDDPGDAEYIRELIREVESSWRNIRLTWKKRLAEGTQHLKNSDVDLVLLDLNLPDSRGLNTLKAVKEESPDIPVVVLTGLDDREFGREAVEQGAQDFLVKNDVTGGLLQRSIAYALERHDLLQSEQEARERLQHALDKLANLNENLEDKVRERTREIKEFLYAASHDLREPSRVIRLHVDEIEHYFEDTDEEIPGEARESLEFLRQAAERQQNLVRGMLKIFRVGTQNIEKQHVSLEHCVDQALDKLGDKLTGAEVTVERDKLRTVYGSSPFLVNLYENLIENAVDNAGDEPARITVTAEREGDKTSFIVRDRGVGMDPETVERLFQPFQSLSEEGLEDSTGMGLTLCRKIVERHGGEIWVESEPGEGTAVKFTLPTNNEDTVITDKTSS